MFGAIAGATISLVPLAIRRIPASWPQVVVLPIILGSILAGIRYPIAFAACHLITRAEDLPMLAVVIWARRFHALQPVALRPTVTSHAVIGPSTTNGAGRPMPDST